MEPADKRRKALNSIVRRARRVDQEVAEKKTLLGVLGRPNVGKSTLISNLLQLSIFPDDPGRQTEVPFFATSHTEETYRVSNINSTTGEVSQEFRDYQKFFTFTKENSRLTSKWIQPGVQEIIIRYPESKLEDREWTKWEIVDLPGSEDMTENVNYKKLFGDKFHELACLFVVKLTEGSKRELFQSQKDKKLYESIEDFLSRQPNRKLFVVLTDVEGFVRNTKNSMKVRKMTEEVLNEATRNMQENFLTPLRNDFGNVPIFLYDINYDFDLFYHPRTLALTTQPSQSDLSVNDIRPLTTEIKSEHFSLKHNQHLHDYHALFRDMTRLETPLALQITSLSALPFEITNKTDQIRLKIIAKFDQWMSDHLPNWLQTQLEQLSLQDNDKNRLSKPNFMKFLSKGLAIRFESKISNFFIELAEEFIRECFWIVCKSVYKRLGLRADMTPKSGLVDSDGFVFATLVTSGFVGGAATVAAVVVAEEAALVAAGGAVAGGGAAGSAAAGGGAVAGASAAAVAAVAVGAALATIGVGYAMYKFLGWKRTEAIAEIKKKSLQSIQSSEFQEQLKEKLNQQFDEYLLELVQQCNTEADLQKGEDLPQEFYRWLEKQEIVSKEEYLHLRERFMEGYHEYSHLFQR